MAAFKKVIIGVVLAIVVCGLNWKWRLIIG